MKRKTHKKTGKMFAFGLMALLATVRSQMTMDPMMMNYLMMSKMSDSSDMKKLLLLSPGLFGQDPTQSAQMNQLMPLLLLDDDSDDLNSKVCKVICLSCIYRIIAG